MPLFNVADVLSLAIDHLKVAWITSDLGVHVDILSLIGQLFRDGSPTAFQPYVTQLLSHVLRVLNICCCVVQGIVPPNYKPRVNHFLFGIFDPRRTRILSVSRANTTTVDFFSIYLSLIAQMRM